MWYAIIFIIWLIGAIIVFCGYKWFEKQGMSFKGDGDWVFLMIILSWISVLSYYICVKFEKKI